jgi:hypothetical protein
MKKLLILFVLSSMILLTPLAKALDVTATNGSAVAIQSAVNQVAAAGGGNVYIPVGTFNFIEVGQPWVTVNIPAGVNLFGAPTQRDSNGQVLEWKTILVMPYDVPEASPKGDNAVVWFQFTGAAEGEHSDTSKSIRVSDIEMIGYRFYDNSSTVMSTGIDIEGIANFRVDHCKFQDLDGSGIGIGNRMYFGSIDENSGVVDHNVLNNTFGDPGWDNYDTRTLDYGISIRRWECNLWDYNLSNIWGKYNNYTIVIENNYFSKWRHSISFNDGMHGIVRFNLFDACYGISDVDGHGSYADSSGPGQHAVGTRSVEVYNNTFQNPDTRWNSEPWALNIRGGSWLVFNNTLIGYNKGGNSGLLDFNNDWGNYAPMSPECIVNQTYVWNNNLGGADIIHYNADSAENVNYFLRAPNLAQDGLTYTPYTYPHPLTQGITPEPPKVKITGILLDKNNQPIDATVLIYQQGTSNIINSTQTINGNYESSVLPGLYDIQFDISNFFIKLFSVDMTSNVNNVINYINHEANNLSFTADITKEQYVQILSPNPSNVYLNQSKIAMNTSLNNNTYYYSNGIVYLKVTPDMKTDCIYDCCKSEARYNDKSCSASQYCSNRVCYAKQACPIDGWKCCVNEETYLDYLCPSGKICSNHVCISLTNQTFGKNSVGASTDSYPSEYIPASKFTMPENGSITQISAYISLYSNGNVKAMIYSDNNGVPSSLLAVSPPVAVGTSYIWANFSVFYSGNANTAYWFALFSNTDNMQTKHDIGQTSQTSTTWGNTWPTTPNPFKNSNNYGPSYSNNAMSIFATYTPS